MTSPKLCCIIPFSISSSWRNYPIWTKSWRTYGTSWSIWRRATSIRNDEGWFTIL